MSQAPQIDLVGPSTDPNAPKITPAILNAAVNAALLALFSQEQSDFAAASGGAILSSLAPVPLTVGSQSYFANNVTQTTNALRAKLGALRSAMATGSTAGSLRLLIAGDSTMAGFVFGEAINGINPDYYTTSPTHVMTVLLRADGWPAQDNAVFGLYGNAGIYPLINDVRISNVTGASNTSSPTVGGNLASFTGVGSGFWFAPVYPVDTFKVWYVAATGNGSFTAIAGGAAPSTVSATGSLSVQSKIVSTGAAPSLATLKLAVAAGGPMQIIGVEAWNSTISEMRILPAGWSGSSSVTWNNTVTPYAPITMIGKLAPDGSMIALMINDWGAATPTTVASYTSNMQTIMNACLASGPVLLKSGIPSAITTTPYASQTPYVAAMYALALLNKCPMLDTFHRWGTYEVQSALIPSMYSAPIHGSLPGYADDGAFMYQFLNTL